MGFKEIVDDIQRHPVADQGHLYKAMAEMPMGEVLGIIGKMTGNPQLERMGDDLMKQGMSEAVQGHILSDPKLMRDTVDLVMNTADLYKDVSRII